jgi:hypothetical protein
MLASLHEQVVQQPAHRLGSVAVALVLGRKGEADLGLARILGLDMGPTVTDQPIGVAQGHGELEPLAGRIGMNGLQLLQELASLAGPVGHLPALVAGGLGVGPVGDEGVQVLGPDRRNTSRAVVSAVKAASPIVCLRCRQRHLCRSGLGLLFEETLFFRYPARRTMPLSTNEACCRRA